MRMHAGTHIRKARLSRGWNQVALAYKSGVGVADVSRIENERLIPSRAVLKKLADALEIPLSAVLDDDGDAEFAHL